ncbi:hypothetical protein EVAR_70627_1 [Eumeta japonica]|uniref:Uncharacterized protein n=1 Tax=Eumeta variegata TaxID=151549 RepID=A0A4C2AC68_EUMVA|nr:hypothetical protein EVAR_70627_1 [Eumeta japonica]
MCHWELACMVQVNNTKMTVSYVAHLPGGISTDTRRCRREIENEEKSEQELSLERIDFSPSWWYFDETLEDAAEIKNEEKSEQELSLERIDFSPSWWYFDETLEDAAEIKNEEKSEQELSLERIDL